jgi:hypothetical protein
VTDLPSPVEGCECGCNDTPEESQARREACLSGGVQLDAIEMIKAQIAAYEEADSLTPEQQESYETAKNVLATVEELTRQGHEIVVRLD